VQDSKSIEELAAQLRDKATAEEAERQESAQRGVNSVDKCLTEIRQQLVDLAALPAGGVRIYVGDEKNAGGKLTGLRVDVALHSRLLARPFATLNVTAYGDTEETGAATPTMSLTWPKRETSLGIALAASRSELRSTGNERVVDEVKLLAAECLSRKSDSDTSLPRWYEAMGTLLGWPVALLVYLAASLAGGFWGVLLGWIPAWIAFALSRALWLPILVVCCWFWLRN
jgi:hypothetical protein